MNKGFLLLAAVCLSLYGRAQNDTTHNRVTDTTQAGAHKEDSLRVGNLIIVRNGHPTQDEPEHMRSHNHNYRSYVPNISTDWIILDLGFANYNDRTNYSSAAAQQFAPGATKDWFGLRTGKSVDVNIWLFMQRLNLIKHVVNLKYGFGIELNNYRYEDNIRFHTNPTQVVMDTVNYAKDKLAVDYFTVPFLLNFNFAPHRRNDYGFSVGASFGYKYSSRQKFKNDEIGKKKTFNSFDLEPWKISWIGELSLGYLKLYGSYATKSMFQNGLDQIPYTVGIRFGHW